MEGNIYVKRRKGLFSDPNYDSDVIGLSGGIHIGTTNITRNGMIRYCNDDLEGFVSGNWVSLTGSGHGIIREHNLLEGLQGGTLGEYYHVTQAEHAHLVADGNIYPNADILHTHAKLIDATSDKTHLEILNDIINSSGEFYQDGNVYNNKDNQRTVWGAGNDLEIFHSGGHNWFRSMGDARYIFQGGNIEVSGTIGVGDLPSDSMGIKIIKSPTDMTAWGVYALQNHKLTTNGTYNDRALYFDIRTVYAGNDNAGSIGGFFGNSFHNSEGDLAQLYGGLISYGATNAHANTTISDWAYGLYIKSNAAASTTTTNLADIYMPAIAGAGTVTNEWSIYDAHVAPSYFAGDVLIGNTAATTNAALNVLPGDGKAIGFYNQITVAPNSDSNQTGYINYSSYKFGNTRWRNLCVGDGKYGQMFIFNGENHQLRANLDNAAFTCGAGNDLEIFHSGGANYIRNTNTTANTIIGTKGDDHFIMSSDGFFGIGTTPLTEVAAGATSKFYINYVTDYTDNNPTAFRVDLDWTPDGGGTRIGRALSFNLYAKGNNNIDDLYGMDANLWLSGAGDVDTVYGQRIYMYVNDNCTKTLDDIYGLHIHCGKADETINVTKRVFGLRISDLASCFVPGTAFNPIYQEGTTGINYFQGEIQIVTDNKALKVGAGNDLEILHSGGANYIRSIGGTDVNIGGGPTIIKYGNVTHATFTGDKLNILGGISCHTLDGLITQPRSQQMRYTDDVLINIAAGANDDFDLTWQNVSNMRAGGMLVVTAYLNDSADSSDVRLFAYHQKDDNAGFVAVPFSASVGDGAVTVNSAVRIVGDNNGIRINVTNNNASAQDVVCCASFYGCGTR